MTDARNHILLDENLHGLGDLGWPLAAGLDTGEKLFGDRLVAARGRAKNIGGRDRILNREINANPANRRHRMRGVPYAQEARLVPMSQAADRHGQELDIIETLEFAGPADKKRSQRRDILMEFLDALRLEPIGDLASEN